MDHVFTSRARMLASLDHSYYGAWPLVGATLSFTVDISQAGCGCNVAAYLVSMAQSTQPCICGGNYYGVLFSYSILQK